MPLQPHKDVKILGVITGLDNHYCYAFFWRGRGGGLPSTASMISVSSVVNNWGAGPPRLSDLSVLSGEKMGVRGLPANIYFLLLEQILFNCDTAEWFL